MSESFPTSGQETPANRHFMETVGIEPTQHSPRDGLLPILFDLLLKLTWELRAAWASGRRVALTLEHCDLPRVEGIVTRVSPTNAYATIGATHVPLDHVLAVHWPSVLGDGHSTACGVGHRQDLHPGQLALEEAA